MSWGVLAAWVLALGAAVLAFGAWLLMILVGIWHGLRPGVPAIGFWEALLMAAIAHVLVFGPVAAALNTTRRN